MWMPRGRQMQVPSPGQNQKVAAFGAINYATGKHLSHVPDVPKGGKNAAQFLVMFGKLLARARRTGKRIILALDNGPIHTARKVLAVLNDPEVGTHIQVLWLPKYAPDLNEQERVWKVAKAQGIANVLFSDRDSLKAHVKQVLSSINVRPGTTLVIVLGRHHRQNCIRKKLVPST